MINALTGLGLALVAQDPEAILETAPLKLPGNPLDAKRSNRRYRVDPRWAPSLDEPIVSVHMMLLQKDLNRFE